jgi:hypothetical protein
VGIVSRQIGKQVTRRATEGAAGSISGWFGAAHVELPELTISDLIGIAAHAAVLGQTTGKATSVALGQGKHSDGTLSANSFRSTIRSESGLARNGASIELFAPDAFGAKYTDWQLRGTPDEALTRVELEVPSFRTREKKIVNRDVLDAVRSRFGWVLANGADIDVTDSTEEFDRLVAPTVLEKGWGAKPATFELDHLRDVPGWLTSGHPMVMPAGSADALEAALRKLGDHPWALTTAVSMRVQRGSEQETSLIIEGPPTASPTARQRMFRVAARAMHSLAQSLGDQPAIEKAVRHYLDSAINGWVDGSAPLRLFWDRDIPVPAVRLPLSDRFPVAVTVSGALGSVSGQSLLIDAAKRTVMFHRVWTTGLRAATREENTVNSVRRFVIAKAEPGKSSGWGRYTQTTDSRPQIEITNELNRAWWWETAVRSRDSGNGTVSRTMVVRGLSHAASQVLYGTELLTLMRGFVEAATAIDPTATVRVVRTAPAVGSPGNST